MQTWAALYHDYPYRETGFEEKINRLLFHTINKLNTTQSEDCYAIITSYFLMWINDPHLRLEGGDKFLSKTPRKTANIPVERPNPIRVIETQCVVTNVIDGVTNLKVGDVILQINNTSIDSLLRFRASNISKYTRFRTLERFITRYRASEIKMRVLRNDEIIDVVFSNYNQPKGWSEISLVKENREKYQFVQDSLKVATGIFYLNAMYPPEAFNRSIARNREKLLTQYRATDSLITKLNEYKALILDVRGRPENTNDVLHYFNECMDINLNRDSEVIKTAFYPVAQFQYDTINFKPLHARKDMLINVPVYVLIDYNTISAAERELLSLKELGRAIFIGSNTAGAAGHICKTKITDNITLAYTTGKNVGLDDTPMSYQGTGIPPDIYAYPTPQGIAEGRDEVLEKAIEIALKNMEEKE